MNLLEQIRQKSEDAKLTSKIARRTLEFDDSSQKRTDLFIQIPFEREFKTVVIGQENEDLEKVLNSGFENYKLLKGFEAIYSITWGTIECEIESDSILRPQGFLIRRLTRFFKQQRSPLESHISDTEEERENYGFEFPSPREGVKIIIGDSSDAFSFLSGNRTDNVFLRRKLRRYSTIRIEGLNFENHNQAKELLSILGNAVFFQIDLITNIPLHLASDRDLQRQIKLRRKVAKEDLFFTAPKFQYDLEAISLYWYARTAVNMPLLQFLAFYQVLEFYFPLYSSRETQEKVKNLLKDPTFDRNSDKNVAKILDIIKVYGKGKSFGDERSQIRATIQSCVDMADLIEFFNEFDERKDFFDDQKKGKSLIAQKIGFNRKDHDLRFDVANRVYDLRCRIVHTKDESEMELLLPFSTDLAHIKYDIDLVEFLARKALIASGKPINLNV